MLWSAIILRWPISPLRTARLCVFGYLRQLIHKSAVIVGDASQVHTVARNT